jgi:hypothetical protein
MTEPRSDFQKTLISALASFEVSIPSDFKERLDVTPVEVNLVESLLTPGLQTSVTFHSYMNNSGEGIKNFNNFKGKDLEITIERPILAEFGTQYYLPIKQVAYRLSNRKLLNMNTEMFTVHGCDPSLLNDANALVNQAWKCVTPSSVVSEVLSACAGVSTMDIESSGPARDYIAKNIHPFKVVAEQAEVALASGDDPSFIHYMTYQNYGTHHFRSLKSLASQPSMTTFSFSETGINKGYGDPFTIIDYSFPCDFDLLSDILNGTGLNGRPINSAIVFNPALFSMGLFGTQQVGCGIGAGDTMVTFSNLGAEGQLDTCNLDIEKYLPRRQARMGLLEQDKIALRMTVPWNPSLNAGKVITAEFYDKASPGASSYTYGSGTYLISSLVHNIKQGGFATTTLDCVSTTVGIGVV